MIKNSKISDKEIDNSKTGERFFVVDEKTTSETPADSEKIKTEKTIAGDVPAKNQTPTEIAQKKCYEEEGRKNKSKANFFDTSKNCVKIISGILGIILIFSGIYLAYYISSIAEPMGRLKESVENIEKTNQEFENRIKALENKLTETREEFIKNSK